MLVLILVENADVEDADDVDDNGVVIDVVIGADVCAGCVGAGVDGETGARWCCC